MKTKILKGLKEFREIDYLDFDQYFEGNRYSSDTTKFEISGVKFEYVKVGYAHSEEDWYLYLPDDKVVLAADVIMNGRVTSNRDGIVVSMSFQDMSNVSTVEAYY